MRGIPREGDTYRQEFSIGNAEDVAEVLSTTYAFGRDRTLDQFVPQALAVALCSGDCLVTKEFTPLEPGVVERKYYAPGIGRFLEVNPDTGKVSRLIGCNVDGRCAMFAAMTEIIDRRSAAWAVLAVIGGLVLFVALEQPDMSVLDLSLELLQIIPIVLTSVGVASDARH